jgi:hypothetical protein
MRRLSFPASVLLIVLASSACAVHRFDALMQSWKGHTLRDLYTTWGPPSYVYTDGQRGRVVVYVPAATPNAAVPDTDAASLPVYSPALTARFPIVRIFFVSADGRIERSEWRGRWECCGLDSRSALDGLREGAPESPVAPIRPTAPASI